MHVILSQLSIKQLHRPALGVSGALSACGQSKVINSSTASIKSVSLLTPLYITDDMIVIK